MKITNAYQAQLARLGGNTDVTVQPPVNKYEKLLGDIEAGGGSSGSGGGLVVNVSYIDPTATMDKTWNEIKAAISTGCIVVVRYPSDDFALVNSLNTGSRDGETARYFVNTADNYIFETSSPDGYPSFTNEESPQY